MIVSFPRKPEIVVVQYPTTQDVTVLMRDAANLTPILRTDPGLLSTNPSLMSTSERILSQPRRLAEGYHYSPNGGQAFSRLLAPSTLDWDYENFIPEAISLIDHRDGK